MSLPPKIPAQDTVLIFIGSLASACCKQQVAADRRSVYIWTLDINAPHTVRVLHNFRRSLRDRRACSIAAKLRQGAFPFG